MGLEKQTSHKTFLSISLGKIRQRVPAGTRDSIERTNEKGNTVTEMVYDSVSGTINKIYYREHEDYGNSWNIEIQDGIDIFNIQFGEDSRYCMDLLSKLPNLDLHAPIKFVPYYFDKDKKSGLCIIQNDKKIGSYFLEYIKENNTISYKNGIPELPKGVRKSDGTYDKAKYKLYKTQVGIFLKEFTEANILPHFATEPIKTQQIEPTQVEEDDLPF